MKMRSIANGLLGFLLLLGFYFLVVSAVSGASFALAQFFESWYWILGLAAGFGIQIALFSYIRAVHRARVSGTAVAVSGTTSGAAMIACCAHYLVNILPIIGIAGIATLIGNYQTWLFAVGLASNLIGIGYMTKKLTAH